MTLSVLEELLIRLICFFHSSLNLCLAAWLESWAKMSWKDFEFPPFLSLLFIHEAFLTPIGFVLKFMYFLSFLYFNKLLSAVKTRCFCHGCVKEINKSRNPEPYVIIVQACNYSVKNILNKKPHQNWSNRWLPPWVAQVYIRDSERSIIINIETSCSSVNEK